MHNGFVVEPVGSLHWTSSCRVTSVAEALVLVLLYGVRAEYSVLTLVRLVCPLEVRRIYLTELLTQRNTLYRYTQSLSQPGSHTNNWGVLGHADASYHGVPLIWRQSPREREGSGTSVHDWGSLASLGSTKSLLNFPMQRSRRGSLVSPSGISPPSRHSRPWIFRLDAQR